MSEVGFVHLGPCWRWSQCGLQSSQHRMPDHLLDDTALTFGMSLQFVHLSEQGKNNTWDTLFCPSLGSSGTLGGLELHSESRLEFRAFPRAVCVPVQFQNNNWILVVGFDVEPHSF